MSRDAKSSCRAGFSVSLDGFSAGIEQSLSDPLGKRGTEIAQWLFHTKSFCSMHRRDGGSIDMDDEFARGRWRTLVPLSSVARCSVPWGFRGPDRKLDLTPDAAFDIHARDFLDLAAQLGA